MFLDELMYTDRICDSQLAIKVGWQSKTTNDTWQPRATHLEAIGVGVKQAKDRDLERVFDGAQELAGANVRLPAPRDDDAGIL